MTSSPCHREDEVLAAVRSGRHSDELRIHATECPECSELLLVAGVLNRGAGPLAEMGAMPDGRYMWWRANLEQRELRSRRATGVITLFERVAVVAGAAVAVMLVWGFSPELLSWFEALRAGLQFPSLPDNVASPSLVILLCLGLLAAPTVFGLSGTSHD